MLSTPGLFLDRNVVHFVLQGCHGLHFATCPVDHGQTDMTERLNSRVHFSVIPDRNVAYFVLSNVAAHHITYAQTGDACLTEAAAD